MASSILSSLFSKPKFSITNQTSGLATAINFKVKSVTINYRSRPHRHTKEDGTSIVDARTILATELIVEGICPDISTLEQLVSLANDRTSMYSVISRGLVFENMKSNSSMIEQTPRVLSASPITLHLKEQLVVGDVPIIYTQSSDSSVIDRGYQALGAAATSVAQVVQATASSISGIL